MTRKLISTFPKIVLHYSFTDFNCLPGISPAYREGLHQVGGLQRQALLLLDVVAHVAELLLQQTHRLEVGRVVEGVAAEEQQLTAWAEITIIMSPFKRIVTFFSFHRVSPAHLDEVPRDVASCDVQPAREVG